MARGYLQMEEKYLLFNLMPMKLDIYTPILPHKSRTSYPQSAFLAFLNFELIELAPLDE